MLVVAGSFGLDIIPMARLHQSLPPCRLGLQLKIIVDMERQQKTAKPPVSISAGRAAWRS